MIKVGDEPFVIEYNVRMGDPETEVVLPRIKNDLVTLFKSTAKQELDQLELQLDDRMATTVMTVSGGYPESYEKGKIISGLDKVDESVVFHAGTRIKDDQIYTNGGRVMAFTSFGDDMSDALAKSYRSIAKVHFDGMYYRKDIGFDL